MSVALALALGPSGVARAQTDGQKDDAKELFAEGQELRDKGDDAGALLKFKGAYSLVRSPITTLEYGRSLMRVGRLLEAELKLKEAADLPEKSSESPQAKDARREAKKLADEVAMRIPTIRIAVKGVPSGTEPVVSIDGQRVPATALATSHKVDPGKHHIAAKLANGDTRQDDIVLEEGEAREVELVFGTEPPAVAATNTKGLSTLTVVSFGIAGLGVVVGSVTGLMAKSKASDLKSSPSCVDTKCGPPEHDAVDSYNRTATISTVSFVLAGVAAGVGIVSLLTGQSDKPEATRARIAPWVGWGSAGVGGAF